MKIMFSRLSRVPVATLLVVVAITAVFGVAAVRGFRVETDLDEYMPADHPAFVYAREAEEAFNISDGVLVAIHRPGGIYHPETLEKIDAVGRALGKLDGVDEDAIMSLATADNISADDWGLVVEPFISSVPRSPDELEELAADVRANPMIHGRLVSEDETAALVIARPAGDGFSDALYDEILSVAERFEGPEEIYVAGRPIVEGALAELGPADMARMGPIVLAAIAVVLLLVLRSVRHTILAMLVVAFSAVWTFGLMAMLGIPVYAVSTMIPVMLVAIGVAYSIHVFNSASVYLEEHPTATPRHLADHAIETITRPVVMAALTTVVGFLSLLSSAVLPVRYFGLFTAFGVFSAMVLSLALIPSSFVLFGVGRRWNLGFARGGTVRRDARGGTSREGGHSRTDAQAPRFAARFVTALERHRRPVLLAAAAIVVVSALAIPRVWVDSSFISNFEEDSQIARTDRFVNERFAGTSTLNVVLEADEADAFKNPELLETVSRLQAEVEQHAAVGDSFGLADFIKRMHQVMHEDDPTYHAVPDSRELVAQYLLLYEMSADPDSLEQVVDYEYRRANVTVQLKDDGSQTLSEVIAISDAYEEELAALGVSLNYAGSGYRALVFSDLILQGQIASLGISLVVVVVLLALMFQSILAGLIGAVPIAITAIVNFGVMGLTGVPLSSSTALISSIAIGIGIDYAIHVIERYKEYLAERGSREEAAVLTMHHSGRAIMMNAIVVAVGFAVLLFSVFPPNRQVGGLIALNMATSFAGTITVLFLLLHRSKLFEASNTQSNLGKAEEEETYA